eukprot:3452406-Pyramimonas_sp.AAC.1
MMDLANNVEAELPNRVVVRPAPRSAPSQTPPRTPTASFRRSSARAGARWRHDWGPGSAQARPCTSGYSAARAGHAPT